MNFVDKILKSQPKKVSAKILNEIKKHTSSERPLYVFWIVGDDYEGGTVTGRYNIPSERGFRQAFYYNRTLDKCYKIR